MDFKIAKKEKEFFFFYRFRVGLATAREMILVK